MIMGDDGDRSDIAPIGVCEDHDLSEVISGLELRLGDPSNDPNLVDHEGFLERLILSLKSSWPPKEGKALL